MALKKRKATKSEEEQLYMLEILVDRLELRPEKNVDSKKCDLMVRLSFVDLTPVDIIVEEFIKAERGGSRNKGNRFPDEQRTGYESGKSCLFARIPSNLIRSIKSNPLSVEVYRIPRSRVDRNSRDDDGQQTLLCAAAAFLPGCFCDRVAAAEDKIDGLPSPYTLKRLYTLTDERGSPCGLISIYLRLSCFGSSIVDHFALHEKSFILQGFPLGESFRDAKLPDGSEKDETKCDGSASSLKILDPLCSKLRERENRADADVALTRPESPPRVSMDQTGFERLTSAEKLNDRKYRGLIYETYPDEPTCSCLPTDRSTHPLMCQSGCVRSCCMALRNPDILRSNDDVESLATYRVDDPRRLTSADSADRDTNYYYDTRMRGGGGDDREDDYSNSEVLWNDEYTTCHRDNINLKNRLAGGSEYAPSEAATTTVIYQRNRETGAGSPCSSHPRTTDRIKAAGCICPGAKENPSFWRTGTSKCTRKPCAAADCLIRAFKEAQDFVDSLGKVPGMAGLGLMDPSESPYFGRDIDKDYVVHEAPSDRKRAHPAPAPPVVQCTAPCNTDRHQIGTSGAITAPHTIAAPAAPMAAPGRIGVVREAIPMLPEATLVPIAVKPSRKKEEKKEEKAEKQKELDVATAVPLDVEVGPCGEPKCKSRRKAPGPAQGTVEESERKIAAHPPKPPPGAIAAAKAAGRPGERGRHPRGKPGPAGDRDVGRGPVKISKRVIRHVYTIGDVYPGINYGHKNCVDPRLRVPANMGWLWNTTGTVAKLKPRIGWKPGAIGRYLHELLKEAKASSLEEDEDRPRSVSSRTIVRRGKVWKATNYASAKKLQVKKEGEEEVEPPPTLHIHRKDGTYYVTMYPIKQPTTDVPQLEEPTKPLQFKIARNRDDASVASSSMASDMEIEFSPPAAVHRYRRRPDVIHVDTQVRQQEILDALKPTDALKRKEKRPKREKRERKK